MPSGPMRDIWILTIACVILFSRSAPAELAGPSAANASKNPMAADGLTILAAHRHYQHYPSSTPRYVPYQYRIPYRPPLRVLPQQRYWYGFGYEYGIPQGRSYWNYGW